MDHPQAAGREEATGVRDARAHEGVERAYIQVRPLLLFLLILYTDYTHQNHDATLTQRGGHTPLLLCCSSFDPAKRRHALLAMSFNTGVEGVVRPLILFYLKLYTDYTHQNHDATLMRQGGHTPSLSCCSSFDVSIFVPISAQRGRCAPPHCVIPILMQRGGVKPSLVCLCPMSTQQGGHGPSLLCSYHFDMARKGPSCFNSSSQFYFITNNLPTPFPSPSLTGYTTTTTVPSLALPRRVESPFKGFRCVRTCRNASKHERHILVGVFFVFRGHLSQPVTASTKTSLCGRHVFMFEGPFSTYAPERQKPAQPVQWVWVWGGTWTCTSYSLYIYCNSYYIVIHCYHRCSPFVLQPQPYPLTSNPPYPAIATQAPFVM